MGVIEKKSNNFTIQSIASNSKMMYKAVTLLCLASLAFGASTGSSKKMPILQQLLGVKGCPAGWIECDDWCCPPEGWVCEAWGCNPSLNVKAPKAPKVTGCDAGGCNPSLKAAEKPKATKVMGCDAGWIECDD